MVRHGNLYYKSSPWSFVQKYPPPGKLPAHGCTVAQPQSFNVGTKGPNPPSPKAKHQQQQLLIVLSLSALSASYNNIQFQAPLSLDWYHLLFNFGLSADSWQRWHCSADAMSFRSR
ncbi:hypothetical protein CBL_07743 [Carabus blaptoides fortunei]